MSKKSLTATMAIALATTVEHGGKLIRHQGAYWTWPDCPRGSDGRLQEWFGTTTIDALVDRGRMKYVTYKEGRGTRFPIVAEVVRR